MKTKVEILSVLFVWILGCSIEANAQLGLNYNFSYSNPTYQSIAHVPGVVQLLDTTINSYLVNPGYSTFGSPIIVNFGSIPFPFFSENTQIGALSIDFYEARVTMNNNITINAGYNFLGVKCGPYIREYVSGGSSGFCLNNANALGVGPGNFVFSSKFSSSNNTSIVNSINGSQVCFANNAISSFASQVSLTYFTGRIYKGIIGQIPNRKFIIEFKNFHSISSNSSAQINGSSNEPLDLINFQIVLFEGSNSIGIHYGNCVYDINNVQGLSNVGYHSGLTNENNACDINVIEGNPSVINELNMWCDGLGFYYPSNNDLLLWSPIDLIDNDGDGFTSSNGDCNENNPAINPTAIEICDNIDNNCNTQIDEGFDQDGDGVTTCAGDCNDANAAVYIGAIDVTDGIDNNCDGIIDENFDADGDGVTPADGDCNDSNPAIGPTQLEVCNSIDDNCNGQIDEGFDLDNDGYTTCGGDCNDANNLINPGVLDLADGIDNDCDGAIDENFDADGDGVTPADGDCNDANLAIVPNQIEYCNGIDDNCNNLIDENFDADNDGFTLCNGDCNDYNAAIYPGAIELDDNVDNNCDGSIDEIFDGDGDGVSPADGDCNDSNPNIGPSALEICNNIDDNCNGSIDEDLDCSTSNTDMFVPTGFSPNNDGFNDSWQIPWLVNQSGYSVMVVNRWEQRVFFTNNFANGWDGTYEGEKLPTADYYYVITLSDGTVLSGALTIKY